MNKLSISGSIIPDISFPTKRQEIPSIHSVQLKPGQRKEETLSSTEIILVMEGELLLSYDHFLNRKIDTGKILLLPPGCHFTVRTEMYTSVLIFRIKEAIRLCEGYPINHISTEKAKPESEINCLEVKAAVRNYISFLKDSMESGLKHEGYLQLKTEELLYLLRSYYTADELEKFFRPLLSSDVQFHQFVLQYYRKIKTVREFAALSNCSISNFDKKFRGAFGTSAYQWMQQKKVDLLYHEINATNKPLQQIAKEQRFLSLPQFNDYCKKHFGYPPGKMRKLASMFRSERSVL